MDRDYLVELYIIYNGLLTNIEKTYFEYYYYEDYSLNEIADNHKVSKSNVGKVINTVENKLLDYEKKLKIYECHNEIRKLLKNDTKALEKIEDLL